MKTILFAFYDSIAFVDEAAINKFNIVCVQEVFVLDLNIYNAPPTKQK